MLDQATIDRMLEQLRAEQEAAEREWARLQHRVNSLRQAVAGLQGLRNSAVPIIDAAEEASAIKEATARLQEDVAEVSPTAPLSERPRGAEAVRRVFAESEGTGWTVREMTEELERRGWTPDSKNPPDAVRTAIMRVWRAPNSGIIREDNKFFYRPSRNGDGPSKREEVSSNEEVSPAVLAFTGGSQQPDKLPEQPT